MVCVEGVAGFDGMALVDVLAFDFARDPGDMRSPSGLGLPPPGRGWPRNFLRYRDLEDCQVCLGN